MQDSKATPKPVAADFKLASYNFELPLDRIAQFPPGHRGESRLMVIDKTGSNPAIHSVFSDLKKYLPENSLLVANNSRVVHARLVGLRPGGGKAEFLLLTPLPLIEAASSEDNRSAPVKGLIRPAAKIKIGDTLVFDNNLTLKIRQKGEYGACSGVLSWQGELSQHLALIGKLPLPPYIRREPENLDESRYQTVYAQKNGSVAAPTAGLHFTEQLKQEVIQSGHEWVEISLHVGYGTFSPVRQADIRQHAMHAEYVEILPEAANAIKKAKEDGRPVIAIGTTSLRAIEGVIAQTGDLDAYKGLIDLFLYPGQKLELVDGLITNFHLPGSTLLMLTAALAGRENILSAYNEAINENYHFFSYGDAMLIRP